MKSQAVSADPLVSHMFVLLSELMPKLYHVIYCLITILCMENMFSLILFFLYIFLMVLEHESRASYIPGKLSTT